MFIYVLKKEINLQLSDFLIHTHTQNNGYPIAGISDLIERSKNVKNSNVS